MPTKTNIYSKMSEERKSEQTHLEQAATAHTLPKTDSTEKMTSICVSISNADKERLQTYARQHGATVSGLIRLWIQKYTVEE